MNYFSFAQQAFCYEIIQKLKGDDVLMSLIIIIKTKMVIKLKFDKNMNTTNLNTYACECPIQITDYVRIY